MQSFCQETTEFALSEDIHKLKSTHHSHHHNHKKEDPDLRPDINRLASSGTVLSLQQTAINSATSTEPGSFSAQNTAYYAVDCNTTRTTAVEKAINFDIGHSLNTEMAIADSQLTATSPSSAGTGMIMMIDGGLTVSVTSPTCTTSTVTHSAVGSSGIVIGASPTLNITNKPIGTVQPTATTSRRSMVKVNNIQDRQELAKEGDHSRLSGTSGHSINNSLSLNSGGGSSSGTTSSVNRRNDRSGGASPSKRLKKSASAGGLQQPITPKHRNSTSGSGGSNILNNSSNVRVQLLRERNPNVDFNIFAKLKELHLELEKEKQQLSSLPQSGSSLHGLNKSSFLLDKLVSRERLNTLILNLYPGNKGYSLAFKIPANDTKSNCHENISGTHSSCSNPVGSNTSHNYSPISGNNSWRSKTNPGDSCVNGEWGSGNQSIESRDNSYHTASSSSLNSHAVTEKQSCLSWHIHETMRWSYEEDELLTCIDNEELPLMFVDLFEKQCPNLFYSGCVIVEVHDYRQSFPVSTACDKFHVLLRPTNQTLLADVNAITSEGDWTHEEKMALESQLIMATAEPLCLDPSPQVGIRRINGHFQRRMFNTPSIRRQAKKFSQVAINRKRKTDQFTHNFGLELYDFVSRYRQKPRLCLNTSGNVGAANNGSANVAKIVTPVGVSNGSQSITTNVTPTGSQTTPTTPNSACSLSSRLNSLKRDVIQPIRAPSFKLPDTLQPPSAEAVAAVERFARAYERPRETKDCMPQLVEEYVLETDRGNGRIYHIKLSIYQRPANNEYLGVLYLDRDYKENERNGEACQFSLGTRAHANRYIQQFTEIFTEEGRKKVKIMHIVPGQQPRITCTTGLWEQPNNAQPSQPVAPAKPVSNLQQPFQALQQQHQLCNKLLIKPSTPNAVTTSPTHAAILANQQQTQLMQPQITTSPSTPTQIKLIGQNQLIGISSAPATATPTVDGVGQSQSQQGPAAPQQQSIQYATIMNCDSSLLKNAIGIRNGSLVLLQQNQAKVGNTIIGANQSQLHVALQPTVNQTRPINHSGVSVLQAQLVGPSMTQQIHATPQQSQPSAQLSVQPSSSVSPVKTTNIHSSNPTINALFTSLLTSANQFEQQQAAAAAAANNNCPKTANNSTIINLLNSAPAAMTNKGATIVHQQASPSLLAAGMTSPPSSQFTGSESGSPVDPNKGSVINRPLNRLIVNGSESRGTLTSPSPPQGFDHHQQHQIQQMHNVRVTMSALATQLASPPAVMTNSPILQHQLPLQGTKHLPASSQATNIKLNLTSGNTTFLNGHPGQVHTHTRLSSTACNINSPPPHGGKSNMLPMNIMSPGSGGDSNHSTTSLTAITSGTAAVVVTPNSVLGTVLGSNTGPGSNLGLTMPTLNTLLSTGGGSNSSSPIVQQHHTAHSLNQQHHHNIHHSATGDNIQPQTSLTAGANINLSTPNVTNSVLIERLTSAASSNANVAVCSSQNNINSPSQNTANHLLIHSGNPQFSLNSNNGHVNCIQTSNHRVAPTKSVNSNGNGGAGAITNSTVNPQQSQFSVPLSPKGPTVLHQIGPSSSTTKLTSVQQSTAGSGGGGSGTTTTLNLQGLNLASLQGAMATIPGLQNVQVQIPGLAQPISLSFSNQSTGSGSVTGSTSNAQPTTGLLVSVPVSSNGGAAVQSQLMSATTGHQHLQQLPQSPQQQLVLTNNQTGQQTVPFAQLVTNTTLKSLNQHNLKSLMAGNAATVNAGNSSSAAPIQLVGLQMNPAPSLSPMSSGTRNIMTATATVSNNQTILSTKPSTVMQRLNAAGVGGGGNTNQIVRNINVTTTGGAGAGTTLKIAPVLTAPSSTSSSIFVNNATSLNPILMNAQHLHLKLQNPQPQSQLIMNHHQGQPTQGTVNEGVTGGQGISSLILGASTAAAGVKNTKHTK